MIGLLRLLLILLVIQTIAYVGLSFYSRGIRRRKLENWWDEKGKTGNKEAFVERGLHVYDNSFRRKLILGVYIVPWVAIGALIYIVNYM
ncbi:MULTISPECIES: hypothetical protein [Ruegeria]|mgnify:CR=1 FL=1|jgi:hypothetical protein|uniref:Uncharacterized protein n=1 Tax=Ruegeria atlantica TaxID=81569 RepID=A0AA91C0P9_9RHOB|nr:MULTISPECIES: hypothetical protein [Ruegeria]MCA0907805.1 hypothetical protein [Ruegeria marisrubri]NOC45957.1 hypothetical protein [Ruegeria sp. HKCCD7559]NOC85454.1 hypothetical protein [Ruegeria sp. HKCCD6428]NOC93966.1 hypothetical protein [Ruegeria sp. HKCCD6604]NOD32004.1 hypothetical protein [Ruegeria atlantica]